MKEEFKALLYGLVFLGISLMLTGFSYKTIDTSEAFGLGLVAGVFALSSAQLIAVFYNIRFKNKAIDDA